MSIATTSRSPLVLSQKAAGTPVPLVLAAIVCVLCTLLPVKAAAQDMPDENALARLVWSSMITLDDANETGNYTVLLLKGAPEFQRSQSQEKLAGLFGNLRQNNVDLSRTLMIAPTWDLPPTIDRNGYLRLRGGFEFRPRAVRFDMLYRQVGGEWRLLGLSVVEMDALSAQ